MQILTSIAAGNGCDNIHLASVTLDSNSNFEIRYPDRPEDLRVEAEHFLAYFCHHGRLASCEKQNSDDRASHQVIARDVELEQINLYLSLFHSEVIPKID